MWVHISRNNSNNFNNPIITSSSPGPSASKITPHDLSPAILSLHSVATTLPPTLGAGITFLIPSATKAKTSKRTGMVIVGRKALLEADGEDEIGSGSGGDGNDDEGEQGGGEGRGKEAALAPDKRGEPQVRFLRLRLQRLRDEAEVTEWEEGEVHRRTPERSRRISSSEPKMGV